MDCFYPFYGQIPSTSYLQDVSQGPPFWPDLSPDAVSASRTEQQGRRSYEKWSEEEKKLLVRLWADNFDSLENKDARKVWERIARELSTKCGTKKTSDKCQKKIKYWIKRYKAAKDWNRRQSGGNRKQSVFYEEIDQVLGCRDDVTLRHVAQAGSSSGSTSVEEEKASNEEEQIVPREDSKKEKRTQRKLSRKRAREEENDQEQYKEMFKAAFSGMDEQRKEMTAFMAYFNRVQQQQAEAMNSLVGALTQYLQNNNK